MNQRRSNFGLFQQWTGQLIRQTFRTPQAVFFTIVFPLLLLSLFSALITGKDGTVTIDGGKVAFAQFFTPSIASFATLTSCFTGLVIGLALERDAGVLKRIRSTPLQTPVFIAARIGNQLALAFAAAVVLFSVGVLAFGVDVFSRLLPAALVTFVIGAISFCAIGMALGAIVPNANSAMPIVNIVVLPMMLLSGVFSPIAEAPNWLQNVAAALPLSHMVRALGDCFNPHTTGLGFAWIHLAVLAGWGAAGALFAVRRFRWEPSRAGSRAPLSRFWRRGRATAEA
jgi:ABC-2 type transport system permease protein